MRIQISHPGFLMPFLLYIGEYFFDHHAYYDESGAFTAGRNERYHVERTECAKGAHALKDTEDHYPDRRFFGRTKSEAAGEGAFVERLAEAVDRTGAEYIEKDTAYADQYEYDGKDGDHYRSGARG